MRKEIAESVWKTPSKVLALALMDLEAIEKMPDTYKINMETWHTASNEGNAPVCHVCLAGSVMSQTLGYRPDTDVFIDRVESEHDQTVATALVALEHYRRGYIDNFLFALIKRVGISKDLECSYLKEFTDVSYVGILSPDDHINLKAQIARDIKFFESKGF